MTNLKERRGSRVHVMLFLVSKLEDFWRESPPFCPNLFPPFLVLWKAEHVTIKSSKMKDSFTPLKPLKDINLSLFP